MIAVKKFEFGPFLENTYILYDSDLKDSIIIDPGNADPVEDQELFRFIDERNLEPAAIILTHSHIDHILGIKSFKEKFNCSLIAPEKDMPLFLNANEQGKMFGIHVPDLPAPDKYSDEEMKVKTGNAEGRFIFTPGHSPGEHCLYFEDQKILFSGDVLFKETIGRTDLWGGDYNLLINSIKDKILKLPGDVVIYPGHGDETTLSHEKRNNPFLKEI